VGPTRMGAAADKGGLPEDWPFATYVETKHSYGILLATVGLYEDALHEYEDLEACYVHLLHHRPEVRAPTCIPQSYCVDHGATHAHTAAGSPLPCDSQRKMV
jgi:hypothetical protein